MVGRLVLAFVIFPFFGAVYCQSVKSKTDSPSILVNKQYPANTDTTKIKGTKQLPPAVRTAFYKSQYSIWYVEKIIRYDVDGKQVYRVYVNNGNLLDGDHHDSFLRSDSLDIRSNGTIIHN